MERVTVRMARSDRRTPWGFGVTEASDGSVLIVNIVGGSLADRAGLRNGDVIDKLEDLDNLDINAVDRLLVTAHEKIELVVTRNSSTPAATRIWRPEISENIGAGNDERPFHVNLQHNNDSRPPQGFNNSALPFETDSRVKHIQYNSPLGIYSDKNAAEQYIQQTDGFINNQSARATAQKSDEPAYLRSETLRLLKEQERVGPPTTLSNHPNPQGLPVCFSCSRPILGVMARAAGKDLHADCLSCATCGNSLRNVGHHFIEDKFYCDIHGTQRKAGGRPGMDPNIFVKSSPTAAQPIRQYQPNHQQQQQQQLSPRGASYAPQINRPTSISPEPLGATGKQVTTHYHTPKTQGILSPSQRGIPTAAFGADLQKTVNYGSVGAGGTYYDSNRLSPASSQSQTRNHQISQVPSLPSNPPPPTSNHELSSSRVPDSVRCAVSPRRSGKTPRQWPPSATASTNRYWQIDAADQLKKEKPNYGEDLATMIKECEKETEKVEKKGKKENKRLNARRASNITKEQVQQAFEEQKRRTQEINKNQEESSIQIEATKSKIKKSIKAEKANQIDKELTVEAPEIKDGRIHWTVIHSPKTSPAHSPAKVSEKAVAQTEEVLKPIAIIGKPITNYRKQLNPIDISKTSIPKPFQIDQINEYHEIRRPVYSSVGIKKPKIDEAQDEGEMEDDDRLRAIDCIAKHQSELEQTQSQLSHLLESAILYLRNLKTGEDNKESVISSNEQNAQQQSATLNSGQENNTEIEEEEINELRPPTPPERRVFPFSSNFKNELPNTQGLHDVLDEFNNLLNHPPTPSPPPLPPIRHNYHQKVSDAVEDSRNFLASRLGQYMTIEDDHKKSINQSSTKTLNGFHQAGSSLTKSTFEKTSFDGRPTAGDFKGNSSPLTSSTTTTTKTTTTQQQSGGRVPFCEACKQQIRGAFVLATGKSWCPEHFVCTNSSCGRRLLECGFVEEDGQKFCESCFERHIAPRCAKCSKPIISDCLNALQKKWHPTCFTCAHCQKPFGNSAFYLEQGLPYCEQDWNALFTTKCISCRYPIEAGDRWVEALGNAFHSNCFTCARCNHNLEGESFFAKNGQPFCKLHA